MEDVTNVLKIQCLQEAFQMLSIEDLYDLNISNNVNFSFSFNIKKIVVRECVATRVGVVIGHQSWLLQVE